MLGRHRKKIDAGRLDHAEEVNDGRQFLAGHGANATQGCRDICLVAGGGIGRIHDPAGIGIIGRIRKFAVGDAVQQPRVFQRKVTDESQARLGLRVRPVVEIAVGNRLKDAQRRRHFVFEIGEQEISESFGFFGIHRLPLFILFDRFAFYGSGRPIIYTSPPRCARLQKFAETNDTYDAFLFDSYCLTYFFKSFWPTSAP